MAQSYGPSPTLPPPEHSWIPTVDIASVNRWPDGAKPTAANGMTVSGLRDRARASAHGLCAAERRRAGRREQRAAEAGRRQGHQGFYLQAGAEMGGRRGAERQPHHAVARCRRRRRRRNAQHVPQRAEFAVRHGAGRRGFLCRQFRCDHEIPLSEGDTKISAPGVKLADLPAGTLNHHWTKDLTASPDGTKLYATVGSNSNVGENGMEAEKDRAAVLEVDRASGQWRVFASGLRNPNGPAWNPKTGELWVVVNERDELGNDLVPDYMTSVKDRRVLRLAVQLLRRSCRHARRAATARSGAEGDGAGLCARRAYGLARARLQHRQSVSARDGRRRLHRPARLVESQAPRRLQGDLRSVQGRQACRVRRRTC